MAQIDLQELFQSSSIVSEVFHHAKGLDYIDSSHDFSHSLRVLGNALTIAQSEGGDRELIALAVLLHDVKNFPKNHPNAKNSSKFSADYAKKLLLEKGLEEQKISIIYDAIYSHSFSLGETPKTIEGKILQDADRIDCLGVVGIIRTFATAGKMGTDFFYHPEDPFYQNPQRSVNDKKYALDHFFRKLFTLENTMQTDTGKRLAHMRTEKMRRIIIEEFSQELILY